MTTTRINRGTTAIFTVRFADQNAQPFTNMDAAKIAFRQASGPREEHDLAQSGDAWTYALDTGAYDRGVLRWWVYGRAGTIEVTDDGDLHLTGNSANVPS